MLAGLLALSVIVGAPDSQFRRGDADTDGSVHISDALTILNRLFLGAPPLGCSDAADADDSGDVDIGDAQRVLNFLFLGGPPPPTPGPFHCGGDPTADSANCERYAASCRDLPNVPPTARCTAEPTLAEAPLRVAFDASSSTDADGAVVEYTWEFGDGTRASGEQVSHRYIEAGTYTAILTVTDNDGASTTAQHTIEALEDRSPPRVRLTQPPAGGFSGDARILAAFFDDPVDPDSLDRSNYRLFAAGDDDVHGSDDDIEILGGRVVHRPGISAVFFAFEAPLAPAFYRVAVGPGVRDLDGNASTSTFHWEFRNSLATQVEGRVVDENGESVLGAAVSVHLQDDGGQLSAGQLGSTTSQPDGSFCVRGIAAGFGPIFVRAEARGQTAVSPALEPLTRGITLFGDITVRPVE